MMACDPRQLAAPGIADLQPYNPGKPIEELERELGVRGAIKLASNENPLGPSPRALAVLKKPPDIARYPDGSGHVLRHKLAARHQVNPDQITLGNGSNDVLELVTRVFVTTANEVVYSEHAFAVYPLVTQAVGARAEVVPARHYAHDLAAMRAAVTDRTRLVFIANPNNPTGTFSARGELREFLESLPGHVIVVVDEAYFEYATAQSGDYPDCMPWLAEFPNLIVTRTFSKVYGLAGLRVGYSVSHPAIADLMNRIRQPFNVNTLALAAAEAALDDGEHVARSVALNTRGMRQLTAAFERLGLDYLPSLGNFVCFDLGRPAEPVYQALLRRGVIVRPIANYGMPNHLRVTVGTEAENARFIEALSEVIRQGSGIRDRGSV
jgi:histidinol-phosphate aminotransferase